VSFASVPARLVEMLVPRGLAAPLEDDEAEWLDAPLR
jgi:hypothetical protein